MGMLRLPMGVFYLNGRIRFGLPAVGRIPIHDMLDQGCYRFGWIKPIERDDYTPGFQIYIASQFNSPRRRPFLSARDPLVRDVE